MPESKWTLDSLNKAYQQGYMTGLAGKDTNYCPYKNDVLIAAWEAGWDDGDGQFHKAAKSGHEARLA